MNKVIEIKELTKEFDKLTAVDNLNLDIYENEVFGLLGVNGAGKTTTIKIIAGLLKKTKGQVTILGLDLDKHIDEIKKRINVSFQETSIAPKLTVLENLNFIAEIYGISNKEERINPIIKQLKLAEVLNQRAGTLSGGYQRRLSIAMSLVNNPSILILDEPTLGLDVISRRELWDIINKIKTNSTIILTTHYLEEVEALCSRVAIMVKGKLKAIGTIEELKELGHNANFEEAFINIAKENEDE